MRELSIREARLQLADIETLVAQEGQILVTRHGKPVARIVPVSPQKRTRIPSRASLRAQQAPLGLPSERHIRDDRDER